MSNNTILQEYYVFDVDENNCPDFTYKNILLLNALIKYNSSYSVASDENNPEHIDSYVGILEKLKMDFFEFQEYDTLKQIIPENEIDAIKKSDKVDEKGREKDTLYKVVESIDRINSTHLVSEGPKHNGIHMGRYKTAQSIREIDNLKGLLLSGDTSVIKKIASASDSKYNFSFATKFCAYVSRHALNQDNYCIYDEVVQSILPYFINKYISDKKLLKKYCKVVNKNNAEKRYITSTVSRLKEREYTNNEFENGYAEYKNIIDEIIKGIKIKHGITVTYEEFDHMLWYYFKGSKVKVQIAMNTLIDNIK